MPTQIKGPVRGFFYAHKAIRVELSALADLAEKLQPNGNVNELEDRVNFLHIFVGAHATGEEDGFYPGLDRVRKDISKAYIWDHKLDEELFESVKKSIARIKSNGKPAVFQTLRRDMRSLQATLGAHAQKEDDLLVPLADAEMPLAEQGAIVGKISARIPPQMLGRTVKLFADTLSPEERTDWVGLVKQGLPPEVFQGLFATARQGVSEEDWRYILERIPQLRQRGTG